MAYPQNVLVAVNDVLTHATAYIVPTPFQGVPSIRERDWRSNLFKEIWMDSTWESPFLGFILCGWC